MEHPPCCCDPAFWMALEARLSGIERTLMGGLTPAQVALLKAELAALAGELRGSRILLELAIRKANRSTRRPVPKGKIPS